MPNDLRAAIEAAYARREQPTPKFDELVPVTKALTELRGKLAAAVRAHATALGQPADLAVQEIHRMHDEVSRVLLYCHNCSGLDLYLDTDGTDTGLQRLSPGLLDANTIDRGWASTNGDAGPIVALLCDLDAFAKKFLADRGYSDIDAASIIANSHAPGEAVLKAKPEPLELRWAAPSQIEQAITAVYDEAEGAGSKPPNVRQIVKPVLQRLAAAGYTATGARIEKIAGADHHKKRRRLPGKTLASEKSH